MGKIQNCVCLHRITCVQPWPVFDSSHIEPVHTYSWEKNRYLLFFPLQLCNKKIFFLKIDFLFLHGKDELELYFAQRWLVRAKEHLRTYLQEQQGRGSGRRRSHPNSFRKMMSSSDVSRLFKSFMTINEIEIYFWLPMVWKKKLYLKCLIITMFTSSFWSSSLFFFFLLGTWIRLSSSWR